MATYLELKQQIQALEQEAEAIKAMERGEVIERMKEAIGVYEITAEELGLTAARRGRRRMGDGAPGRQARAGTRKAMRKTASAGLRTYGDESGNTWGGRGPRPRWLRDALAGGAKLEDFAKGRK